jgi:hypothetical protein
MQFKSSTNYGCDQFVPMAISWFFEQVESGIILEDDCLISEDFYRFSAYLLEKYADNNQIMNISASNFQDKKWGNGDYYFSRYPANWAWATWRRAWVEYDSQMNNLDFFLSPSGVFNAVLLTKQERRFWKRFFLGLKSGKYTFWDAKWVYSIWKRNGVSITPNQNLSTNIGFGNDATHTKVRLKTHALRMVHLDVTISDPESQDIERKADYLLFKKNYKPSFKGRLKVAIDKIRVFVQ